MSSGIDLESRVKTLEKEVQDIKEPLTNTLMDLRKTISELENPFNYVTKILEGGLRIGDKEDGSKIERNERNDRVAKNDEQLIKRFPNNSSTISENNLGPWQFQLNVLVISDMLLKIFGKEELKKVMGEYVKDGWIDRETAKAVEDAINKIGDDSSNSLKIFLEDHLLALYLLYRLSSYPTDPMLPILVILLNRAKGGSKNSSSTEGRG
ncbi:MAG: hypothetical protein NZ896_03325 [Nitrososphaerales archaeon]|nr:hypothetical protein [Nitrososphaerales archaeon]